MEGNEHRFGPNGDLVEQVLGSTRSVPMLHRPTFRRLVDDLCGLPATGAPTPGAAVRDRIDRLIEEAGTLDVAMLDAVRLQVHRQFDVDLELHVPAGEARDGARRVLLAAALWPGVHGRHQNPFATGLELARGGSFVEVGEQRIHAWHHRLDVPFPLACAPTQSPESPPQHGLILPGD